MDAARCAPREPPRHPRHDSASLRLTIDSPAPLLGTVRVYAGVTESVPEERPIELELELHRPDGLTFTHRFRHHNEVMVCPGCDPLPDGSGCDGPRCFTRRTGDSRIELPHDWIRESGSHALVVRRRDTGEQRSVVFQVDSGFGRHQSIRNYDPCTGSDDELGDYRRVGCDQAALPLPIRTKLIASRIAYEAYGCSIRVHFFHGPPEALHTAFASAEKIELDGAQLYRKSRGGWTVTAWANDPVLVWVESDPGAPNLDSVLRELLSRYRPVGQFQWKPNRCDDARAIEPVAGPLADGPTKDARRMARSRTTARASGALDLAIPLARVRALVASHRTPGHAIRDAALESWLSQASTELQRVTGEGALPFTPGKTRKPNASGTSSYGSCDALLIDGDLATQSRHIGFLSRALVLVDGDLDLGFARDSIVIATGRVRVAFVDDSFIIAGKGLRVSHAGRRYAEGRGGIANVLLSGTTVRGPPWGAIVSAPDGADYRPVWRTRFVSSPAMEILAPEAHHRSRFVFSDAPDATVRAPYEAFTGEGEMPRVCLFERGRSMPAACGLEGQTLDGRLRGWTIAFASHELVVLRKGDARLVLRPDRSRAQRMALPQPLERLTPPPTAKAYIAAVYKGSVPFANVRVDITRSAQPIVLVLTSYEAVSWEIHAEGGAQIAGVVLGGVQYSPVRGLPPGTPIVTRIHALGERALLLHDSKPKQIADALQQTTGRTLPVGRVIALEHAPPALRLDETR